MVISVITITYNNVSGLKQTIESVQNLKTPQEYIIEFIIVDGASTDKTNEIVEQAIVNNEDRGSLRIIYRSEPDKGIYDAMNKGIQKATGEWIIFMNAGDVFSNNKVISKMTPYLNNEVDVFYGDCIGEFNGRYHLFCAPDEISFEQGMPIYHQSCIFRGSLLKTENYSMKYKLAGDYELVTRIKQHGGGCFITSLFLLQYIILKVLVH